MPQKTFASNKSSLFADGSSNLGGGADDHMPVGGPYSGYTFRSAVRFALDFSGVKSITKATLRLKTSDQVHVAFSSDPDIYVARATADWTANSSSGSSDGGSGWGTSPTVYPGPSSTSTNRVSRDVTTSQNATVDIDITGIVRDWMAGNPNYGVLLYYVASGDITEFYSYRHGTSGNRPSIILDYNTDTPPTAAMDGPTGAVGTVRPPLTGSGSDIDGDAITDYYIEVRSGATPVYTVTLGVGGPTFYHTPTADLPGGALTAVAKAMAGGVWSDWSNAVSFTVDRPPVVGAFSSPPASGSARRPPITFAYSDPDGNVADLFDVEVYATSGGAPVGSPVYSQANLGASASPISHTPTADLPGGNLVVRSRVRSGPAYLWSAWSGYHPFLIALTSPTLAWLQPVAAGSYIPIQWLDHIEANFDAAYGIHQVEIRPPSGQTLTRLKLWISGVNADPSVSGSLVYDLAPDPAGGLFSYGLSITPSGQGIYSSAWEATASGGGTVKGWRMGRMAATEYEGRVFLGDNVTALAPDYVDGGGDDVWRWYRAENAAGGLSAWGTSAAALAAMPAQGAYVGLRGRTSRNTQDQQIIVNGDFEQGQTGWRNSHPAGQGRFYTQPDNVPSGGLIGVVAGPTTDTNWLTIVNDTMVGNHLVVPGATYVFSGWVRCEGVNAKQAWLRLHQYAPGTFAYMGPAVVDLKWAAGEAQSVWVQKAVAYTVPQGVGSVAVEMGVIAGPIDGNEYKCFDKIRLDGPLGGAGGIRSWRVDWTSAG